MMGLFSNPSWWRVMSIKNVWSGSFASEWKRIPIDTTRNTTSGTTLSTWPYSNRYRDYEAYDCKSTGISRHRSQIRFSRIVFCGRFCKSSRYCHWPAPKLQWELRSFAPKIGLGRKLIKKRSLIAYKNSWWTLWVPRNIRKLSREKKRRVGGDERKGGNKGMKRRQREYEKKIRALTWGTLALRKS